MAKMRTEAEWQADNDANTLSEAKIIQGDKKRMGAAKRAGQRLVKEQEERTKALRDALAADDEAAKE